MEWNAYRSPFIGKASKGHWYYEWQVGPVVLMWQYDMDHKPQSTKGIRIRRFHAWIDSAWKHEVLRFYHLS